jgi:hypothetical protein
MQFSSLVEMSRLLFDACRGSEGCAFQKNLPSPVDDFQASREALHFVFQPKN